VIYHLSESACNSFAIDHVSAGLHTMVDTRSRLALLMDHGHSLGKPGIGLPDAFLFRSVIGACAFGLLGVS
jgi:hypothetical protein